MGRQHFAWIAMGALLLGACGDEGNPSGADQSVEPADGPADQVTSESTTQGQEEEPFTLRGDVQPITRVEDAQSGVIIPPFLDCRDPLPGDTGSAPDGKVCTHVSIAGCTEPGKYFPDYASCEIVRTQRPYWSAPPAGTSRSDDPRLEDAKFVAELAWVTEQARASACTCCHDGKALGGKGASQWDISVGPIWTDTVSNTGLALFAGLADSSALGAYPASDNHGFERDVTGLPSTDGPRMKAFFEAELARRGISQEQAARTRPFGGPVYVSLTQKPTQCSPEEGVDAQGRVHWTSPPARYVYVLKAGGARNPGVFPNLDLPENTLWRLDVLASAAPLESGIAYGSTPEGSFQAYPERERAPSLEQGETYQLFVAVDAGIALTNCLFTYQGN